VMSIGLKDGFFWSEQTLGDYSENTIMREARVAVVKCSDEGADAKGNLTYMLDCTNGTGNSSSRIQLNIVANVDWRWKVGVLYRPEGTYVYTQTETLGGGKCVATGTASGSIVQDHGTMFVRRTRAEEQNARYGYEIRFVGPQFMVNYKSSCRPPYSLPGSLHIFEGIHGPNGSTGMITGQQTNTTCNGAPAGLMKWSFAVPDPK
jgi:hypothetical protein